MKAVVFAAVGVIALVSQASAQRGHDYQSGYAGDYVVCESRKGRTQYCAMDTRRGVVLVNQLSRTPCIEGETWGVDRRGLWVTQGCRGEFEPARSFAPEPRRPSSYQREGVLVVCESEDFDQTYCPIRIRGEVHINRQLSVTECEQGYNWDYDRRGIWVDEGCRAEFIVY